LFTAETAPELLLEGSVREEHVEDLLGPARPPKIPTNLVEKLARQQERLRRRNLGKEMDSFIFFVDWIDGNSIGHDPLIYIEGVVLS
jgi:hypothetical protein